VLGGGEVVLKIERIGDLLDHELPDFFGASPGVAAMNQERT